MSTNSRRYIRVDSRKVYGNQSIQHVDTRIQSLFTKTSPDSSIMEKANAAITIESMPCMSQASSSSHVASTHECRKLDKSEYKQAAQCLAEAFKDDDVVMYFIKTGDRPKWTAEEEWKLHVHIMECIVYAHCMKGAAFVIGPNHDCVALW